MTKITEESDSTILSDNIDNNLHTNSLLYTYEELNLENLFEEMIANQADIQALTASLQNIAGILNPNASPNANANNGIFNLINQLQANVQIMNANPPRRESRIADLSYFYGGNPDINLVALPDALDLASAAALGCRFATAFRAVLDVGRVTAGEWVAVHGCGGVGLSAVMIAAAAGAHVVAVDVDPDQLALARELGAEALVDARDTPDVGGAVAEASGGGAHVSLDALGHSATAAGSIMSLRRRGRHVQVGLLAGEHARPALPMERVIAHELQVLGSHGMPAHRYPALLGMVAEGRLAPERLLGRTISLEASIEALMSMDRPSGPGVTVITDLRAPVPR
jgi:hypothetical protein